MKDVSFIVKSFERPYCTKVLVDSIRKFYPKNKIIIADDSETPVPIQGPNVTWFDLPHDSGVSKGRNELIKRVKTKYFVLLDDDFIFTDKTKIEYFVSIMENTNLDICAGDIYDEHTQTLIDDHAYYSFLDNSLHMSKVPFNGSKTFIMCHHVPNFFIAKTSSMIKVNGWDQDMKVAESYDFFIRCFNNDFNIAYTPHVRINHVHVQYDKDLHKQYRNRGRQFIDLTMFKHNLKSIHFTNNLYTTFKPFN